MPATLEEGGMSRSYPPEFKRKVLNLVAAGRKVADIAADLGVNGQTIYSWRNQALIDPQNRAGRACRRGPVERRDLLGGLIHEYSRAAA